VPKNLLVSALQARDAEAIERNRVRQSNVRDLCTLITLSVLYDTLETLGHKSELNPDRKPHLAEKYQAFVDELGLTVVPGPRQDEFKSVLDEAVGRSAQAFAEHRDLSLGAIRDRLSAALRQNTSDGPDYWQDFAEGERLLRRRHIRNTTAATDAEKFVLRSFLYAGLASVRRRPLVLDTVRAVAIKVPTQSNYGDALEKVVEAKYQKRRALIRQSPIRIHPFAEEVLRRCKGDLSELPDVVKNLRQQLRDVRVALAALEAEGDGASYDGIVTIFGSAQTTRSKVELDARVATALEALRKAQLPVPSKAYVVKPLFYVVKAAVDLVGNIPPLRSKWFSKFLSGADVISGARDLREFPDRATFLEIHHQLGRPSLRSTHFQRLFGDVIPES
jgi:hypothetical protein